MSMRSTIVSGAEPAITARGALSRCAQICCHLICVGRPLANRHLHRVPFHLCGIVRAVIL